MRTQTNSNEANRERHSHQGFSLIELLIVVAIILVIAAIAIPNLLRARMAANEAAAATNVRTVTTASLIYSTTYSNGYPPALANLGGGLIATCNQASLIDPIIATAPNQKSGFTFQYTGQGAPVIAAPGCGAPGFSGYLIAAVPTNPGITGIRSFCSDTPGVIHYDPTGLAPGTAAACDALPSLQ
jgi:type IV pilus assembly protein PilA